MEALRRFFIAILEADELVEFCARYEACVFGIRLWALQSFRIVHGDLDIQMADITPVKAFRHAQGFAVTGAGIVEPSLVVKARSFHHERIAFPLSDRVSHPGRLRIFGKRAAIGEHLAKSGIGFV